MYRPPENAPPAGLLTAGDHDDLLNPLLYARYVTRAARDLGQTVSGLPRVDTRRALTISVEDESGRPVPFARVTVSCADGNHLDLATLADGRVVLFPALDRLGDRVTIEAGGVRRAVAIDKGSGGQEQQLVIGSAARPVRNFDLMIALEFDRQHGRRDRVPEVRARVDPGRHPARVPRPQHPRRPRFLSRHRRRLRDPDRPARLRTSI